DVADPERPLLDQGTPEIPVFGGRHRRPHVHGCDQTRSPPNHRARRERRSPLTGELRCLELRAQGTAREKCLSIAARPGALACFEMTTASSPAWDIQGDLPTSKLDKL